MMLEAEREIARVCGLYESGASFEGAVVFRIERAGGQEKESAGVRTDASHDEEDTSEGP